ncbi:hypothetical protein CEXT_620471 [Caerostris extrusa]|uniref:Uncharacterized protein n=1 Tax=Caerostris extrusa TaxID=172846 RepID=A0AAV4M6L3_CAEEX|nr:hypothetical protein CEXT_620471 [Caerostris extrusa]
MTLDESSHEGITKIARKKNVISNKKGKKKKRKKTAIRRHLEDKGRIPLAILDEWRRVGCYYVSYLHISGEKGRSTHGKEEIIICFVVEYQHVSLICH